MADRPDGAARVSKQVKRLPGELLLSIIDVKTAYVFGAINLFDYQYILKKTRVLASRRSQSYCALGLSWRTKLIMQRSTNS